MKQYFSKLLLFGEYTIIQGGQALALPLERYSCHWTSIGAGAKSKPSLRRFYIFLKKLESQKWLQGILDLKQFATDLKAGYFLESNIPIGYGLGSSGALCAAVYDRYAVAKINRDDEKNYAELRHILGLMESYFHGSSSGVDPLICYLNQPVLIKPGAEIERVSAPLPPKTNKINFFLLDTQTPRKTGPLVEHFLQKCEDSAYAHRIKHELIPQTEATITAFLQGRWPDLMIDMHSISLFQWKYFREMIPEPFQTIWSKGLESNDFKLKLCGAGGGGFLLGITNNTRILPSFDTTIMML